MCIIVILIGVAIVCVGIGYTVHEARTAKEKGAASKIWWKWTYWITALGLGIIGCGIYAWIRKLGPLDSEEARRLGRPEQVRPGFYIEWWDAVYVRHFFGCLFDCLANRGGIKIRLEESIYNFKL